MQLILRFFSTDASTCKSQQICIVIEIQHNGTECAVLDETTRILVEGSKLNLKSILLAEAGDFQCRGRKSCGVCATET
jgi:hypothetical protein